ncbi:tpr domain containing protein [Stylonychia lemnae]|uniref:Tpr domain containing protein n=1 Tax=Stylonychia lemnae TaxID=5949 RepID=A0A078AQG1_STYLE|nr:tpr domain containing protein [Stylonychia lemnae]|eukprot:CDW84670.1 tpr domain containing protein [Stylonychia lemnae]
MIQTISNYLNEQMCQSQIIDKLMTKQNESLMDAVNFQSELPRKSKANDQDISISQSILSFINNEELILTQHGSNRSDNAVKEMRQSIAPGQDKKPDDFESFVRQQKSAVRFQDLNHTPISTAIIKDFTPSINDYEPNTLQVQVLSNKGSFKDQILQELSTNDDSTKNCDLVSKLDLPQQSDDLIVNNNNVNQNLQNFKSDCTIPTVDSINIKSLLYSPPQPQLIKQDSQKQLAISRNLFITNQVQTAFQKLHSPIRLFSNENLVSQNNLFKQGQILQGLLYKNSVSSQQHNKSGIDLEIGYQSKQSNDGKQNEIISNDPTYSTNGERCRSKNLIRNESSQRMKYRVYNQSQSRDQRIKSSQLIKEGRLDEAMDEVNQIIQSEANSGTNSANVTNNSMVRQIESAQAFYLRGQIHEKKGDYQQAITDFKLALQHNPQHVNAAFSKAVCENKIGNFEDAINTYHEAFAMENDQNLKQLTNNMSYYLQSSNLKNTKSNVSSISNESQSQEKHFKKLNAVKSTEKLTNNQYETLIVNRQSPRNQIIYASRIETLSPKSQSEETVFQYNCSNHNNFKTEGDELRIVQNRTIISQQTNQSSDQFSKFGKVQINLDDIKKIGKDSLKTTPLIMRDQKKSKAQTAFKDILLSPQSIASARDSSLSQSRTNKNLNKRIETLVSKFDTHEIIHIEDGNNQKFDHKYIEKSLTQFKSNLNLGQRNRNRERNHKFETLKADYSKMINLKKLKTTIMQKSKQQQQQYQTNSQTHQMFNKQNCKIVNQTTKKDYSNASTVFQNDSNYKPIKTRKISHIDTSITQKLNFTSTVQNLMVKQQNAIQVKAIPVSVKAQPHKINIVSINIGPADAATSQSRQVKLQPLTQSTRNLKSYSNQDWSVERESKGPQIIESQTSRKSSNSRTSNNRLTVKGISTAALDKNSIIFNAARTARKSSDFYNVQRLSNNASFDKDAHPNFFTRQRESASRSNSAQSRNHNQQQSSTSIQLKVQLQKIRECLRDRAQINKAFTLIQQIDKKYNSSDKLGRYYEEYHLLKHEYLYKKQRYQEALSILTENLRNTDTRYQKLKVYYKMGETQKVLEDIQKILVHEQSNQFLIFHGYYMRGKIYMLKQDYKNAILNFNNAQVIDENSLKINVMRAICQIQRQQIERSKDDIQSFIQQQIQSSDVKYIVKLLDYLEKHQALREILLQILDLSYGFDKNSYHYNKFIIRKSQIMYNITNDRDIQLQILQDEIQNFTDDVLQQLISVNFKLKQINKCLEYIDKFQNKQSNVYSYWSSLINFHKKDFKNIIQDLNYLLLTKKPQTLTEKQYLKSLSILSNALYNTAKFDKALKPLNILIQHFEIIILQEKQNIASGLFSNSEMIDAEAKIQRGYEKLRDIYTMRGKSYQKLLKFEEAVADFTKLIDNEMQNCKNRKSLAQTLLLRAMSFEEVGQQDRAMEDKQRAIEQMILQ